MKEMKIFAIGNDEYEIVDDKARNDIDTLNNNVDSLTQNVSSLNDNTSNLNTNINSLITNVKNYGALGDGVTDDTTAIQNALNVGGNIYFPKGVYMINAVTSLFAISNSNIIFDKDCILKAITNNSENYAILRINGVSNVNVSGGIFEGERETHTGTTGEWGHCISIRDSMNVKVEKCILKNAWGDGVYLANSENVVLSENVYDNNRRQGLSIISVTGFRSLNERFLNTNGTDPSAGIDIEPNESSEVLKDIIILNPYTYNNKIGICIYTPQINTTDNPIDIKVINHHDDSSINALAITNSDTSKGSILIDKPYYKNSSVGAIKLYKFYDSELKLTINKPVILDCNTSANTTGKYVAGISLYKETSDNKPLGNVTIINPYITTANGNFAIYMVGNSADDYNNNVTIINPLNRYGSNNISIVHTKNLTFKDEYKKYVRDINYTGDISGYELFSEFANSNFTSSRGNHKLSAVLPVGVELTFRNINPTGYDFGFDLPATNYCRYFSNNPGININLARTSDRLKIKKISDTEWEVLELIGEPVITEPSA